MEEPETSVVALSRGGVIFVEIVRLLCFNVKKLTSCIRRGLLSLKPTKEEVRIILRNSDSRSEGAE